MSCNKAADIHRYYDNELAPGERQQVEEHFGQCEECRRLFQELCCLSRLLGRAARAEAPSDLMVELRQSTESVRNRTIIRLAGWLTAAAAALLLGAWVTWPASDEDVATFAGLRSWEIRAVTPTADPQDEAILDGTLIAEWTANEFSSAPKGDAQ